MGWLKVFYKNPPRTIPPAGVLVLDDHWWRLEGVEPGEWGREIYRCARCDETSRVFANPPKIWAVKNLRTGQMVRTGTGPAGEYVHVEVRCRVR